MLKDEAFEESKNLSPPESKSTVLISFEVVFTWNRYLVLGILFARYVEEVSWGGGFGPFPQGLGY